MTRSTMAQHLRVYMRVPKTEALGPGKRYALWVQGCSIHCEGCLAADSQPEDAGTDFLVDDLVEEILAVRGIEGLTVSGGEPFEQAEGVLTLVRELRRQRDLGLIIYSGYRFARLRQKGGAVAELLSECDVLVDGPYLERLNDGMALRGSSNQRAHALTNRYLDQMHIYGAPGRSVEVRLEGDNAMMVGVPSNEQLMTISRISNKSAR